jgi:biotin carboxyl carrier protein
MEDERTVTYFAEIVVKREGEEVRLDRRAQGSSVRELAANLLAQASELESQGKEKLDRAEAESGTKAETEKDKRQRAELSGRRHRSWE